MFICDVSGHGVPAAMTASMISMAHTEASNINNEMPGADDEKFRDWIKDIFSLSPSPGCLCDLSLKRVSEFTKRDSHEDEFTIIAAEFTD
jgi:serine phosphatase RsbU (regulator of sigma subunit)